MSTTYQQHTLNCQIDNQTAALERFLRVIRVRGFELKNMQINVEDSVCQATFTLAGNRAIDNLMAQLHKLIEVKSVSIGEQVSSDTQLVQCA